jgi:hypothetical protein
MLDESKLHTGLVALNRALARLGRPLLSPETCTGTASHRLYYAKPISAWVNMSQKDAQGRVLRDMRHEIAEDDLL